MDVQFSWAGDLIQIVRDRPRHWNFVVFLNPLGDSNVYPGLRTIVPENSDYMVVWITGFILDLLILPKERLELELLICDDGLEY